MENAKNNEVEEWIRSKNYILQSSKDIESLNPKKIQNFDIKNKLIAFGHNPEKVKLLYNIYVSDQFNSILSYCLDYTDQLLKNPKNKVKLQTLIAQLKGVLYLLDEDDLNFYQNSIYKNLIDNPEYQELIKQSSKSLNSILLTIEKQKTEEKAPQKVKKTSEIV